MTSPKINIMRRNELKATVKDYNRKINIFLNVDQFREKKVRIKNYVTLFKPNVSDDDDGMKTDWYEYIDVSIDSKNYCLLCLDKDKIFKDGIDKELDYTKNDFWTIDPLKKKLEDEGSTIITIYHPSWNIKKNKPKRIKIDTTVVEEEEKEEEDDEDDDDTTSSEASELETFGDDQIEKYIPSILMALISSYVSFDRVKFYFHGFKMNLLTNSNNILNNCKNDGAMTPRNIMKHVNAYYEDNLNRFKPNREQILKNCKFNINSTDCVFKDLQNVLNEANYTKYDNMLKCINMLTPVSTETDKKLYFYKRLDGEFNEIVLKFNESELRIDFCNKETGNTNFYTIDEMCIYLLYCEKLDYTLKSIFMDICRYSGIRDSGVCVGKYAEYSVFHNLKNKSEDMKSVIDWVVGLMSNAAGDVCSENCEKPRPLKKRKHKPGEYVIRPVRTDDEDVYWCMITPSTDEEEQT